MGAPQASASILIYDSTLSGSSESPPNASPGLGSAQVIINDVADTMELLLTFSGLLSPTTASHIHCCTPVAATGIAEVATQTPTLFPLGVTSGTVDQIFDMTSLTTYNPAFVTDHGGTAASAFAALLAGLSAGEAYFDIHTATVPSGEIRGFLAPAVPEPSTWAMLLIGFAGIGFAGYRNSRRATAPAYFPRSHSSQSWWWRRAQTRSYTTSKVEQRRYCH
jgi:hypothetical protein